jgi:hypothetical protein
MEQPIEFVIRGARANAAETLREYTVRRLSFTLRRFSEKHSSAELGRKE